MKNGHSRSRTTDEIKSGAESGHVGDKYTLSRWHHEGKYSLDKNILLADEYFKQVYNDVIFSDLYFTELMVNGFKGIIRTKGSIELDSRLNVFVGVNGCGKTTLLESLAKSFSWIINIIKSNANGLSIKKYEVSNSISIKDCFISSSLNVGEFSKFDLTLAKSKIEDSSKPRSHLEEFKKLGFIYSDLNSNFKDFCLPVFVFYQVGRALDINYNNSKLDIASIKHAEKLDAYENYFGELGNYKKTLEWLISNRTQSEKNNDAILSEISILNSKLEQLSEIKSVIPVELLSNASIGGKLLEQEAALISKIDILKGKVDNTVGVVDFIKHAISHFMGVSNIRTVVDNETVKIVFDKDGVAISALDLSHGEKSLFSLVTDISRRLYLLNPNKKGYDALNGCGVVLIDEIEVHLHPSWQQTVVPKLTSLFKNIQFVLTTHSPQVVTTVPEKCIKIIKNNGGELEFIQPDFSYGSESSVVMEEIFGVNSRPNSLAIVCKLDRFRDLITQDLWDSEEALSLAEDLNVWARDLDPVMKRLQMDITLRKRRRGNQS
jgi:predicted ATP-binding protein involved in virulence